VRESLVIASMLHREPVGPLPAVPGLAQLLAVARTRLESAEPREALDLAEHAAGLAPRNAAAQALAGLALQALGRSGAAMARLRRSLLLDATSPQVRNALGIELLARSLPADAAAMFRAAAELAPAWLPAVLNLALAEQLLGLRSAALASFARAVELGPEVAECWNGLGTALQAVDRIEEAIFAHQRAVALRPDFPEAKCNLGRALRQAGRLAEAVEQYDAALAARPDYPEAHWNRALLNLLRGRFAEAWEDHEWRWRIPGFPTRRRAFARPLWNGEPLVGRRILLHAEQGFGDTIQFLRYVPLVALRGARVILELPRELERLAHGVEGVDALVVQGGGDLPEFDLHAPLLSLPRAFRTTLDSIPAATPYLWPDQALLARWTARLPADGGPPRIGLVWAGRPTHPNDASRSLSLRSLRPLLELDGLRFCGLQLGAHREDIAREGLADRIEDLSPDLTDFAETAAALCRVDLLVAVDTAVVHLAGALGRQFRVLLPFAPDWRWLATGSGTPWYPTGRLLRQAAPGDWSVPLAALAEELAGLATAME
jgi:Flp pilus assembly protein TadD